MYACVSILLHILKLRLSIQALVHKNLIIFTNWIKDVTEKWPFYKLILLHSNWNSNRSIRKLYLTFIFFYFNTPFFVTINYKSINTIVLRKDKMDEASLYIIQWLHLRLSFVLKIYCREYYIEMHTCTRVSCTYAPYIHPSIHPYIHLFIHTYIHPFIYSFSHLSIHPSINPSIHARTYSYIKKSNLKKKIYV